MMGDLPPHAQRCWRAVHDSTESTTASKEAARRPFRRAPSWFGRGHLLERLQKIFTKHHTLGPDEQDYTDTAAYAEQFIQQVARLRDKERRSYGCHSFLARCLSINLTTAGNILFVGPGTRQQFDTQIKVHETPVAKRKPGRPNDMAWHSRALLQRDAPIGPLALAAPRRPAIEHRRRSHDRVGGVSSE